MKYDTPYIFIFFASTLYLPFYAKVKTLVQNKYCYIYTIISFFIDRYLSFWGLRTARAAHEWKNLNYS